MEMASETESAVRVDSVGLIHWVNSVKRVHWEQGAAAPGGAAKGSFSLLGTPVSWHGIWLADTMSAPACVGRREHDSGQSDASDVPSRETHSPNTTADLTPIDSIHHYQTKVSRGRPTVKPRSSLAVSLTAVSNP